MKFQTTILVLLSSPATAWLPSQVWQRRYDCYYWYQATGSVPTVKQQTPSSSVDRYRHAWFMPFMASAVSATSIDHESNKPIVKRLPNSAVEIQIPVPGNATQAAYDKVCTELSKQISIPGFRKGSKIPPAVLEQSMAVKGGRYALRQQAIQELLSQLVESTLKEQALNPIGQAILQVPVEELAKSFTPGEPIVLPVQCDVWPEIHWMTVEGQDKPYVGLKGQYSRKAFNQEKLDMALRDLKERYATLIPIDDPDYELQMGDACTVNMDGYMATPEGTKGDALPNAASGDRVEVVLGPGRYMEGLVEGLVGAKKGEVRMVSVTFPEKLRDKMLAGKRAIFDVEILEPSRRTVPDVTDEFAAKVRAGLTADSLMKELIKAIDQEDAKEFAPARNKALSAALAEVMDVEVPDTLVTNQAREKFALMMTEMRDGGVSDDEIKRQINPENFNKYKEIVKDDIIRDFKVSMATDEIARLEGITVPDYQVDEQLQTIKKDAGESKDFDESMIRAKVQTTLERQAVMDWLADNSQLEVVYEDEKEFDEALMQQLAEETLDREQQPADADDGAVMETTPVESKSAVVVADATVAAVVVEIDSPSNASAPVMTTETEEERAKRYASMSPKDRAYQILVDTGAIKPTSEE